MLAALSTGQWIGGACALVIGVCGAFAIALFRSVVHDLEDMADED